MAPGNVRASFYNPELPGAETLAVYVAPSSSASTHDLGTPKQVAQALAAVAANSQLQVCTTAGAAKERLHRLFRTARKLHG